MGYGFSCNYRKNDEESLFYAECQYAYESIFKKAFGTEIQKLGGRVTKEKTRLFKEGLNNLKINKDEYSKQITYFSGNLSNRSYDGLLQDFEKIIKLIDENKVGYLSIG